MFNTLVDNFKCKVMKGLLCIVIVLFTVACRRELEPWTEQGEKKELNAYVKTGLSGVSPVGYQLFVYDSEKQQTEFYEINPETGDNTRFRFELPAGNYSAYCLVNAVDESVREYNRSKGPGQIFIKLRKIGDTYAETGDYLLGSCNFVVNEETLSPVVFDLNRRVAQLRIITENVPEWMEELKVLISSVPDRMNLLGEYSGTSRIVSKPVGVPEAGKATTTVLVFPGTGSSTLALSYRIGGTVFTTDPHPITTLTANKITEIKVVFSSSGEVRIVDFQVRIMDWDAEVWKEGEWILPIPPGPCEGVGNGINLVKNGGFEEGTADSIPVNWKIDKGGADQRAILVTDPVAEGMKAVRLEGKTYLYQDVEITGGQCYQLKMWINNLSPELKWRYWCTWMAGSRSLNSDGIRADSYLYGTEGYVDVFKGGVFRAPREATRLRMEIRTYSALSSGEGVYVDDVSVEKVE